MRPFRHDLRPGSMGMLSNTEKENAGQPTSSAGSAAQSVDISSVITQVTARNPPQAPSPATALRVQQARLDYHPQVSLGQKLRSLLCCFAPERGGYFKADAPGALPGACGPPRPGRGQTLVGEGHDSGMRLSCTQVAPTRPLILLVRTHSRVVGPCPCSCRAHAAAGCG